MMSIADTLMIRGAVVEEQSYNYLWFGGLSAVGGSQRPPGTYQSDKKTLKANSISLTTLLWPHPYWRPAVNLEAIVNSWKVIASLER